MSEEPNHYSTKIIRPDGRRIEFTSAKLRDIFNPIQDEEKEMEGQGNQITDPKIKHLYSKNKVVNKSEPIQPNEVKKEGLVCPHNSLFENTGELESMNWEIMLKGGIQVQEAVAEFRRQYKGDMNSTFRFKPGTIVTTLPGHFEVKGILHVVSIHPSDEPQRNSIANALKKVFEKASKLKYNTLSIPFHMAGSNGTPEEHALGIAKAIEDIGENMPIKTIRVLFPNEESYFAGMTEFKKLGWLDKK